VGVCVQCERAGVPGERHEVHVDWPAASSWRLVAASRRLRVPRERDVTVSLLVADWLRLVPQLHIHQHGASQTRLWRQPNSQASTSAVRHLFVHITPMSIVDATCALDRCSVALFLLYLCFYYMLAWYWRLDKRPFVSCELEDRERMSSIEDWHCWSVC